MWKPFYVWISGPSGYFFWWIKLRSKISRNCPFQIWTEKSRKTFILLLFFHLFHVLFLPSVLLLYVILEPIFQLSLCFYDYSPLVSYSTCSSNSLQAVPFIISFLLLFHVLFNQLFIFFHVPSKHTFTSSCAARSFFLSLACTGLNNLSALHVLF
jgi:hypothetical protein